MTRDCSEYKHVMIVLQWLPGTPKNFVDMERIVWDDELDLYLTVPVTYGDNLWQL